jgi:hypothetical protein
MPSCMELWNRFGQFPAICMGRRSLPLPPLPLAVLRYAEAGGAVDCREDCHHCTRRRGRHSRQRSKWFSVPQARAVPNFPPNTPGQRLSCAGRAGADARGKHRLGFRHPASTTSGMPFSGLVYSREMDATGVQLSQQVERAPPSIMRRYQRNRHWRLYPKEYIYRNFPPRRSWLDFGCGTGEITTQLAGLGHLA